MLDNRFYVYGHYDGDELVYVGMGQKGRAFDCRSDNTRQLNEHTIFMTEKLTEGDVSFVKFFQVKMYKEDAEKLEKELIKKHDPKFNLAHTSRKRVKRGEESANSLLTEDDVFVLKYLAFPCTFAERKTLASALNVNVCTLNDIHFNRSWRHV